MTDVLPAGSLDGKVALVTGSSRGIGADTVRYLAEAGADVVINFRNKAPRAEKLAAQLRELGRRALVVGADLTTPSPVAEMFDDHPARSTASRRARAQCVPAAWSPAWPRTTHSP